MPRRQHISHLMSEDLLIERSIRVLSLTFRPGLTGDFGIMRGVFVLTGNIFEVLLLNKKLVSNMKEAEISINSTIKIDDYWNITRLT